MSPRQWCALFCFYTAYLFFGASVFYYTEREYEVERRLQQLQERIEINELLTKYTAPNDEDVQHDILHKVTKYCGKKVTNHTLDKYVDPYQWTFYHSVFFAFTVCSTLGYGNIAPTQTFGQYFMIVYALVGIPVNGILYAYLGDYFGETFIGAYSRYKNYKMANDKDYVPRRWNMIAQITLYLVPAAVVLIFLPSCLFTYFEGWPYSVSVYYSFVTLSTIGFGDFIPTFQPHQERVFGVWFQLYQAFIIIWFVFGLSYLLMLIGFIARGMRSKQITRLEHQLSENIKLTQQRIWTGVTRDVSYLRKIFNEIYIMRFKPAYDSVENGYVYNILTRSESCPNLAMYHPHYAHHHHHHYGHHQQQRRRRAHSEHDAASYQAANASPDPNDGLPPTRRSDADLLRVDRQRTLDDPLLSIMHTGDVLARVVQALGSIGQHSYTDRGGHGVGYHGLSDSQILADEAPSSECPTPPRRPRLRAASEYRGVVAADRPPAATADESHEWTWSGTHAQMAELRKMRARMNRTTYDLHRQAVSGAQNAISIEISPPSPQPPYAATAVDPMRTPPSHWQQSSSRKHSVIDMLEPSASSRRSSVHTDAVRRQYQNATQRGRPSVFAGIAGTDQELLEKTTIADLLRAIEVAHIQEHVPETVLLMPATVKEPVRRSPRLMGAGNRRASMFPGYHSCVDPDRFKNSSRRSSLLPDAAADVEQPKEPEAGDDHQHHHEGDNEDDDEIDDDVGPPEPPTSALFHKHQKSRRASMFPANFKSFQKLTETILNDGIGNHLTPPVATTTPVTAPQLRVFRPAFNAAPSSRRASMCPTRRAAAHSNVATGSATTTSPLMGFAATGAAATTHRAGRRVSLIPGAGRHAIPERLLREYAHVPRETHALSRQHHRASGRQTRHFLSAPIGGAFAMPMSPARRKNSATTTTAAVLGGQRLMVAAAAAAVAANGSPLMRDARTTASSPHLSVRRDSAQLLQVQPVQQRGNVRHHVFRPLQAVGGGGERQVSESGSESGEE